MRVSGGAFLPRVPPPLQSPPRFFPLLAETMCRPSARGGHRRVGGGGARAGADRVGVAGHADRRVGASGFRREPAMARRRPPCFWLGPRPNERGLASGTGRRAASVSLRPGDPPCQRRQDWSMTGARRSFPWCRRGGWPRRPRAGWMRESPIENRPVRRYRNMTANIWSVRQHVQRHA